MLLSFVEPLKIIELIMGLICIAEAVAEALPEPSRPAQHKDRGPSKKAKAAARAQAAEEEEELEQPAAEEEPPAPAKGKGRGRPSKKALPAEVGPLLLQYHLEVHLSRNIWAGIQVRLFACICKRYDHSSRRVVLYMVRRLLRRRKQKRDWRVQRGRRLQHTSTHQKPIRTSRGHARQPSGPASPPSLQQSPRQSAAGLHVHLLYLLSDAKASHSHKILHALQSTEKGHVWQHTCCRAVATQYIISTHIQIGFDFVGAGARLRSTQPRRLGRRNRSSSKRRKSARKKRSLK